MIAFFPESYPDELMFSMFSRYYEKSGYMTYRSVAEDLYINRDTRPDIEFINPLSDDAKNCLTKNTCMEEQILNHTMFPYYARFLPADKRNGIYKRLENGENSRCALLKRLGNGSQERYLRYCPVCVKEDRKHFGETYWHRLHQIPEITICPIHHCRLVESKFRMGRSKSSSLHSAEELISMPDETPYCDNKFEIHVAEFLKDILWLKMDLRPETKTGDFLDSRLEGTEYKSVRGEQRNIAKLAADYLKYYENFPQNTLKEVWQIQKIFTGNKYNPYEICLMAIFLNINPQELVHMKLPSKRQHELFDENIENLHQQGLSYRQIAEKMNASYDLVKVVGKKKNGNKKKACKSVKKGGVKKKNWNLEDEKMLPVVKKLLQEIKEKDGERPVRITVFKVEKELGLPSKHILKLDSCMKEIEKYTESQEEYWVREILWAVQDIEKKGEDLHWTNLRKRINLRREDFRKCIPALFQVKDRNILRMIQELDTENDI